MTMLAVSVQRAALAALLLIYGVAGQGTPAAQCSVPPTIKILELSTGPTAGPQPLLATGPSAAPQPLFVSQEVSSVCGNGVVEGEEQCEPNMVACSQAGTACNATTCKCYQVAVCGNGAIENGEMCENHADCDVPIEGCVNCQCKPSCGNGVKDAWEQCETPADCPIPSKYECRACSCMLRCGNGVIDQGVEQCEKDVHCGAGKKCVDCQCISTCGNGVVDAGEMCENNSQCGPMQACTGCQCVSTCGNGVIDAGEMCENDSSCPAGQTCNKCKCIPPPCQCGQKTETIEGDGKVTGGGWIYLTEKTYYNAALICNNGDSACNAYGNTNMGTTLNQTKANYGFNAMWRNGLPRGSTNFDFDGGLFHFHSTTGNTPYKFLEVIDPVHARWMGTGTLSSKLNPRTNDWKKGYCFMVAVQDHGEPGADDTWRIRIWDCKTGVANNVNPLDWTLADFAKRGDILSYLVFDSNFVPNSTASLQTVYSSYIQKFPLPNVFQATDPGLYRFNGTNVGELHANGGGNIQIHLKGKTNKALDLYIQNNGTCECENATFQGDGNGFVTGGGWVYLTDTSYLKDSNPCADATCEVETQSMKANFGFNAKFIGGVPRGSTNFNIEGKFFHFHTATGGQPEYDGLEVICADTPYGKAANGVYARWTGIGKVARTAGIPADGSSDWKFGYRFYVAVQDNGEPGMSDTWRIRILDLDGTTVLFDSDNPVDADSGNAVWKSDPLLCCPNCNNANSDPCRASTWVPSFTGDALGEDYRPGGGNIQVHCKGGPS